MPQLSEMPGFAKMVRKNGDVIEEYEVEDGLIFPSKYEIIDADYHPTKGRLKEAKWYRSYNVRIPEGISINMNDASGGRHTKYIISLIENDMKKRGII
jgi:hypothetical protein